MHFYFETSSKEGKGVEDVFTCGAKMLFCDARIQANFNKQKPKIAR